MAVHKWCTCSHSKHQIFARLFLSADVSKHSSELSFGKTVSKDILTSSSVQNQCLLHEKRTFIVRLTALWSTTRTGTPIGKAITDDKSHVYDFIREDDGYFERFRIYFTLHVWRERMSEESKSQLSTRSQKGLTVLRRLAWGNYVYFDSWEFNTQIWCKTQTVKHNICPTS